MIILFLAQLFFGTIVILELLGRLLLVEQKNARPENLWSIMVIFTIIISGFYCMVAYYYSRCMDIYAEEHKGNTFTVLLTFFLLAFMLNGQVKYFDTKKQRRQILLAGTTGTSFFIIVRFFPGIGDAVFGWLPIFIWI